MGEMSSEQLGEMNGEALCQLPEEYLNNIPDEAVANLSDAAMGSIIFSIDAGKANGSFFKKFKKPGWNIQFVGGQISVDLVPSVVLVLPVQSIGIQIAWLTPNTISYFTSSQVSMLTPLALGALQPEQVPFISLTAVQGLSQMQVQAMNYNARLAFTLEQDRATDVQLLPESYPVSPEPDDTFIDDTSTTDDTSTDDTSTDDTSTDDTSTDNTSTDDSSNPPPVVPDIEEPIEEPPVVNEGETLPPLGDGFAMDADGNPITTDSEFEGAVLVDGEPEAEVSLDDEVDVEGEINVDSQHIGLVAEIVVFASFGTDWYMLDPSGAPVLWESGSSEMPGIDGLVAFKTKITLKQLQPVKMYKGKFVYAGLLNIFYGYRITEGEDAGTIVTNNVPMDIDITESNADGESTPAETTPDASIAEGEPNPSDTGDTTSEDGTTVDEAVATEEPAAPDTGDSTSEDGTTVDEAVTTEEPAVSDAVTPETGTAVVDESTN